jgi:hypothetical protein
MWVFGWLNTMARLNSMDGKTQYDGWQDSIRWMARLNTMDGKTQYDGWQDSIINIYYDLESCKDQRTDNKPS